MCVVYKILKTDGKIAGPSCVIKPNKVIWRDNNKNELSQTFKMDMTILVFFM